jgi:hypothetical protein
MGYYYLVLSIHPVVTSISDLPLESLFGSRTRLLTMAVLANAEEPLTGYRIAKVADLPRQKVYPELRKGIGAGLIRRAGPGFVLADPDVRSLLRKRVRIRWDEEWDRSREGQAIKVPAELNRIRSSLRSFKAYDPKNRIPTDARRELQRDPVKNRILRELGLRPSSRKQ